MHGEKGRVKALYSIERVNAKTKIQPDALHRAVSFFGQSTATVLILRYCLMDTARKYGRLLLYTKIIVTTISCEKSLQYEQNIVKY